MDHEMDFELQDFKLPPPKELPEEAREALINNSLVRIWDGSKDLQMQDTSLDALESPGMASADMWMLLLVRLVTRVVDPAMMQPEAKDDAATDDAVVASDLYAHQDRLRQTLCDYIMADFSSRWVISAVAYEYSLMICRIRLATTWMNEEWYNDQIRSQVEPGWVSSIQATYRQTLPLTRA